ncbi:MAG: quinoprotein dehydrogenase-associated SoxYZ-like carrier [Pseudomonadota bacterium]
MNKIVAVAAFAAMLASSAWAEDDTWAELQPQIFGDAIVSDAGGAITLDAPYRTMTDPRTTLGATITAPLGKTIETVTLIIDENPMPVSAVFDLASPRRSFAFTAAMRMNGPSPVRVVAELSTGERIMQSAMVKTSGTGACAAAPTTDPVVAMETLGQMDLVLGEQEGAIATLASLSGKPAPAQSGLETGPMAELQMQHPSHSGMQMDQITLLYIPARYVETVEVSSGGQPLFSMTGSISLSENPAIGFDVPEGASAIDVRMTDTEGAVFENSFPLVSG